MVNSVEILNCPRASCGKRLAGNLVTVGGRECGRLPTDPKAGEWYTVKCATTLYGGTIRVIQTKSQYPNYLEFSGIKVNGCIGESLDTIEELPVPAGEQE